MGDLEGDLLLGEPRGDLLLYLGESLLPYLGESLLYPPLGESLNLFGESL